ncbi:hypothetical protein [Leuconostoc mesenteroides]|uniref:hypothetical protein n=1 Tax=Leuconostoc mesenteroides TaxID=1245 RepID=UPI0013635CD2|nr:hypothetical protein [Leuconostoc mesenteroides]QHM55734.1 hypothetical protein C7M43_00436 [Leuconostoc mesenteroides]
MKFDIVSYNGLIDKKDLFNYSTGCKGLDDFILKEVDGLEKANNTALSIAYYNDTIVGMYALSVTQTMVSNDHTEKAFGKECDRKPLLSLDHFSVNKLLQYDPCKNKDEQLNIGKNLLFKIFELVVKMRNVYNIAVAGIFVSALPEAVDWYCKQGFDFISDIERDAVNQEHYLMIIGYSFIEKAYFEAKSN